MRESTRQRYTKAINMIYTATLTPSDVSIGDLIRINKTDLMIESALKTLGYLLETKSGELIWNSEQGVPTDNDISIVHRHIRGAKDRGKDAVEPETQNANVDLTAITRQLIVIVQLLEQQNVLISNLRQIQQPDFVGNSKGDIKGLSVA